METRRGGSAIGMSIAPFTLRLPGDIRFGRGVAETAVPDIAALGRRVFLVHGRDGSRVAWLARALGPEVTSFACDGEPDLDLLDRAVEAARGADVVVACGGGAALDLGKAVAALAGQAHPALDYLEVVGNGRKLDGPLLPFVAIPTTAGTGAEVTKNAVIGVPAHRRKVSLRDDRMLARIAVVDPGLTDGCPRGVTLGSGLDACVQVIEPYLCTRANPVTDAICAQAIPMGLSALARLMETEDPEARDAMAWVSLAGGMALANAGLGAVHGLAGPLGGVTGGAHGALCGRLLPGVLAANAAAVEPEGAIAGRFTQIMGWLQAALGVEDTNGLAAWIDAAGLPRLGGLGLDPADIAGVAAAAASSSSMRANPAALPAETLEDVMHAAL